MNGILLPGNSLKFPLVKVIVSKIAYKSLKTTKNSHFLRTDHRNVVHENFFRDFGDIICIKNLFRPIRVINRTNSWAIWTRIGEDIDHFSKWPAPPPKKKTPILLTISAQKFFKRYHLDFAFKKNCSTHNRIFWNKFSILSRTSSVCKRVSFFSKW